MSKRFSLPPAKYRLLCYRVHTRDKWTCQCCKKRRPLSAHHIIYRSRGGGDYSWNMISLCAVCHAAVHTERKVVLTPRLPGSALNADQGIRFIYINNWRPT